MISKRVSVTFSVSVTVDETKFTPEFNKEFNDMLWEADSLDDHFKHIAYLKASDQLYAVVEGYGDIKDFGIRANIVDIFEEIEFEEKGE